MPFVVHRDVVVCGRLRRSRRGLCWLGGGEHGEGCAHVVPVRLQISIEGKLLWSVIMVNNYGEQLWFNLCAGHLISTCIPHGGHVEDRDTTQHRLPFMTATPENGPDSDATALGVPSSVTYLRCLFFRLLFQLFFSPNFSYYYNNGRQASYSCVRSSAPAHNAHVQQNTRPGRSSSLSTPPRPTSSS